jgi:hypothetical protein
MGNPLTIKDNYIRLPANLPESLCQRGCLAKGQESGHIWKFYCICGKGLFGQDKIWKTEYQYCCIDFSTLLLIRNIGPGDSLYWFCEGQLANQGAKAPLNDQGFLAGKVPGMECARVHRY